MRKKTNADTVIFTPSTERYSPGLPDIFIINIQNLIKNIPNVMFKNVNLT